ncbi:MAG: GNAT family N-acetyltransferase [Oscillospiraceae bacterium]|nr:GNAT family N-acetyltransferase [Oscillospiraceae bacterium]
MIIRELDTFDLDTILNLYSSVGWTNYTDKPEMLKKAYENSLLTLGAYDGDKLVGVIRTVGDGFSIVVVQDILVFPEYQRKGIGTQLLREIMERFSSVYQMELMTDNTPKTISFYQSAGFVKAEDMGCCAFMRI